MNDPQPPAQGRFLWSIHLDVAPEALALVEACLEPLCDSVSSFIADRGTALRVEGIARDEPDRARLRAALNTAFPAGDAPRPVIDLIPPKNWLAENLFDFPPLSIGRFFIHGSHFDGPPPMGALSLLLDAGTAFGSGTHGSTAGCLTLLGDLARRRRPKSALDMGCGSGILAIAMAKLWRVSVVASDIDGEAARVTAMNAARNAVGHRVAATTAVGYGSPLVRHRAPYDLIVENILARPIRRLSRDLAHHLAPGGACVLSGLLARDAGMVITAHRRQGLRLVRQVTLNGWRSLVFEKPPTADR